MSHSCLAIRKIRSSYRDFYDFNICLNNTLNKGFYAPLVSSPRTVGKGGGHWSLYLFYLFIRPEGAFNSGHGTKT